MSRSREEALISRAVIAGLALFGLAFASALVSSCTAIEPVTPGFHGEAE